MVKRGYDFYENHCGQELIIANKLFHIWDNDEIKKAFRNGGFFI